jgi:hypothetical protein
MVNDPEKRDPELDAVEAKILRERDEILAERSTLVHQRNELLIRLRQADRRLADCRAAARFFGLKIDFPDDENEQIDRIERARAIRMAERAAAERAMAAHRASQEHVEAQKHFRLGAEPEKFTVVPSVPVFSVSTKDLMARIHTKKIRDVVLERLEAAGGMGSKASAIREFYERAFGKTIHEKTVGMTLYRLQREGLVRREGHTWFLAPPKTETENPGGDTPGPINP